MSVTVTLTPSADTTSPGCAPEEEGGLPRNTLIAIAVGASVGGLIIIGVIVVILVLRFKKKAYWNRVDKRVETMRAAELKAQNSMV